MELPALRPAVRDPTADGGIAIWTGDGGDGPRRSARVGVAGSDECHTVADELSSGLVSGLEVLVGGRSVLHWDDGLGAPHLWMSVSKVVASLILGILADQDLLSYDDPVLDHLPELGPQWQGCRLRDVADMASGVRCPEVGDAAAYTDPRHPFYRFEASLGWRPAAAAISPDELVIGFGRRGRPGTTFEYTSANTFLLAWLIERVTGLTYVVALRRVLWDQLALAGPAAMCVNGQGVAVSHGGLIMTVDDLARLGTVWTPSSTMTGHQITAPASHLAMITAPRPQLTPGVDRWPTGAHPAVQWNLVHADGDMFKSGFGGQGLYVSPRRDVVVAFCGVPDARGRSNQLATLCRDLARAAGA